MKKLRSAEVAAIQREIDVHSSLNHPNIVFIFNQIKFYGHFTENQKKVMVLEYAHNGSLSDYLYKHTKMTTNDIYK
jgi:serine/threonine protein kinase